jgi:hypothetical protein
MLPLAIIFIWHEIEVRSKLAAEKEPEEVDEDPAVKPPKKYVL